MSLVYVLLFNARTDNEGIHTLHEGDRDKVLMFEEEDDATRYALMLEALDLPPITVEGMDAQDIIEFCKSANYGYERIEAGQLTTPPENNVMETDWQESGEYDQKKDSESGSIEPEAAEMSNTELDRIRNQLEGLL